METRIIKAVFGASKSIVAPKRFKNDWGQVLELVGINLPQVFEVHFSNSRTGTAKKRVGQDNRVDVPAEYFESGADIYCWVMVHDAETDGRTMYTIRIPIEDRADATDVEPTPVEQDVITQAIAALNSAVEKTAQDVESADASAQSAKADADRAETARDTAEEYAEDAQTSASNASASAQSAAQSATASANSASQAQQIKIDIESMADEAQSAAGASAQSALESAQSASQALAYATSASQSAETASTKASEASTSAQTASTKATESSGYASTASQKASESSQSASAASGYATQAGQAKTAAETAQGLAEQAQSDAESAKDDAESARDEAQQIVSGISSKVEQIDQNTSNIASLEADRYKAYATDIASGSIASFPDGADNIPMADVKVQIEPVQEGSGDPSPDNVRPITGWTGCEVQRTGKNLFDKTKTINGFIDDINGEARANSSPNVSSDYILIVPNQSYYIKSEQIRGAWGAWYDKDKNYISGITGYIATASNVIKTATAPSNAYYMRLTVVYASNNELWGNPDTFSVNYPATDHDYHPYTGDTYSITFPTEAGTVYGGELDVTNGVLTVDRAMVDLGTLTYATNNHATFGQYFFADVYRLGVRRAGEYASTIYPSICSAFKCTSRNSSAFVNGTYCFDGDAAKVTQVQFKDSAYSDAASFKSAMNGVQLVYELATPVTYQLTPTEIRSLLGTNNVWADTGDSTAEYRADTKLYIQKKITEAVNALT